MKFLAYSSLVFLLAYSPACQAHVGDVIAPKNISGNHAIRINKRHADHHHQDRDSTKLPGDWPSVSHDYHEHQDRYSTSLPPSLSTDYPDYQEHHTTERTSTCDTMIVFPTEVKMSVGQNLTLTCTCITSYQNIDARSCPEWKQVNDVLHIHRRGKTEKTCTANLEIYNINLNAEKVYTCVADNFKQERRVHLHLRPSSYEEQCRIDEDCSKPYSCKNFKCDCPDEKPLHFPSFSEDKCHSERRLMHSCWNSIQCQATDKNAQCLRETSNSTAENGVCACKVGYEVQNGKCICSDSMYEYVYSFSKRYRTVFYVLLGTCSALILLGLIRICVIYRRGPTRRLGRIVSTSGSDAKPIVTSENEKPKL